MNIKENFSRSAAHYEQYRPLYPKELFDFLLANTKKRGTVWDCATGNGQVARVLSEHYKNVVASDVSQAQLDHAIEIPNIEYVECPAEKTPFANESFDLVVVAQAIHWFNFKEFYEELHRVCTPGAHLAIWGYSLIKTNNAIDELLSDFYHNTVGKYWDEARKHVETGYRSIPFNFKELKTTTFENKKSWTVDHFIGYLSTWTSVTQYKALRDADPIELIKEQLIDLWGPDEREVTFNIFFKMGKVK